VGDPNSGEMDLEAVPGWRSNLLDRLARRNEKGAWRPPHCFFATRVVQEGGSFSFGWWGDRAAACPGSRGGPDLHPSRLRTRFARTERTMSG